jgi:predicted NBD/HSP70 family sugar kinase
VSQRNAIERDILSAIFRLAQPTRRSIAEYLDVSHVTVGKALQAVEAAGEISATESVLASGSGRPSDVFSIRPDAFFGIGLYVQPDRAVAVLVDASKHTVGDWSRRLEDRPRKKDEVEALLQDVARWALDQTRDLVSPHQIRAVGLSVPGFVDTERRHWTAGLQFGDFSDMDVRSVLADVLPCEVHLEDTSRSLTHLELMRPSASLPTDYMVVINMGVGMGAGVVVDGEVLLGNGGIAGEIGHIPLGNNANRCACGNLGCSETVLSGWGIRSEFARRLTQGVRSALRTTSAGGDPTIDEILIAAGEGDHFAVNTLRELGALMGDLVDILLKVYTPCPVVLAGEGARLAPHLIPSVKQGLSMRMLPEMRRHFSIVAQAYDGTNEATGAAFLSISRMLRASTAALDRQAQS